MEGSQPETGDYARDLSRLPLWLLVIAPAAAFGAMASWDPGQRAVDTSERGFHLHAGVVLWLLILCGQHRSGSSPRASSRGPSCGAPGTFAAADG